MTTPPPEQQAPADAIKGSWVQAAPSALRPYLQLSRYDRPAGFWLLGLPCLVGIAFARQDSGLQTIDALWGLLFMIGSLAMRGAGCTYNDILDRDFDAKVERTALRPLPAGSVSVQQAWIWLILQCLVGLGVLFTLPRFGQYIALASLPLVALYPLMKRITWWPQVWLGLTLNWGLPVAIATIRGSFTVADVILYLALIAWTVGYDTIYATQDREGDALIGVRSTARLFGDKIGTGVWLAYALSILAAGAAGYIEGGVGMALATAPFAVHLILQGVRFTPQNNALTLRLFQSNRDAALLLIAGWVLTANFV